ncbi:MAG: biotin--[acetyl-CoA-carboxylase] ligase [Pseudomonadota bacterium]|jgi:BirA family biotin operon repressor/biotin-[acetyl-CoA-carboxylase] ligase
MTDELRESWGLQALQQDLQRVEPGLTLEVVESLASTNTALLERVAAARAASSVPASVPASVSASVPASVPAPASAGGDQRPTWTSCLLVAQEQTQGRGRQGRAWHAQPGSSLTFSLGLSLAPQDWSGLSLAVGVALADALDPARGPSSGSEDAAPRILLKWPNDLWLRDAQAAGSGRKLGGVLIETATAWEVNPQAVEAGAQVPSAPLEGDRPLQGPRSPPRICVIGVGLNIGPQSAAAVEKASSGVAWLQEIEPQAQAAQALARVALPLLRAVRQFEHSGFAGVAHAFARRDLLRGQAVSTTLQDLPEGMAQGVDDAGALQVQAPDGTVRSVVGGEVSIRLRHGAAACA